MALTDCIECGKQISDAAAACPNCGKPNAQLVRKRECPSCKEELPHFALNCKACGNEYIVWDERVQKYRKVYDWEAEKFANSGQPNKAHSATYKSSASTQTKLKLFLEEFKTFSPKKKYALIFSVLSVLGVTVFLSLASYVTSAEKTASYGQLKSCVSLHSELSRNAYVFREKYTSSVPVRVKGSVNGFRKTIFTNELVISLDGGLGKSCAYNFPSNAYDAKKLYRGKEFVFKCKYVSGLAGHVSLFGCRL